MRARQEPRSISRGLVTPEQLSRVLEEEMGFPRVELESYAPDSEALEIVPANVARAGRFLPLFEIEGMLTVAIGDPADVFTIDAVGSELGLVMDAVLADGPAVQQAIVQYFGEEPAAPQPEPVVPESVASEPEQPEIEVQQADETPSIEVGISAADFFELLPGSIDEFSTEAASQSESPVAPEAQSRRPDSRAGRGGRGGRRRQCRRSRRTCRC